MSSLREIAAQAKVTQATVSRALRGHTNVDPATAAKIRRIAEKLGYTHNPRVSKLMSLVRSSRGVSFRENLAFVWFDGDAPEIRRSFQLKRFEAGAVDRAVRLGFGMDVFYLDRKPHRWQRLRKIFYARNVRGVVFGPVLRSAHAHLTMPLDGLACASIGEGFVYPRLSHARFDHFVGMRTALHELKKQGSRRIGFALEYLLNARAAPIIHGSFMAETERTRTRNITKLWYSADYLRIEPLLDWAREAELDAIILSHDIPSLATLSNHPQLTRPLKVVSFNRLTDGTLFGGIDQRQDLIASHACDLVIEQLNANQSGAQTFAKVVLCEGEWRPSPEG